MKKLLISLTLILCLLASTGCYVTKAAKIKDIVGTYQLTSYTNDGVNVMEKRQMTAYLVITNSGTSYYYLKEGEKSTLKEVSVRFIPDEQETNKYSYVEFSSDGINTTKLAYAYDGLNSTQIRLGNKNGSIYTYQIYTSYKKVSKAQDLSYLTKTLGQLPNVIAYGKGLFHGIYSSQFQEKDNSTTASGSFDQVFVDPYVYFYIDVNFATNTATAYYVEKANDEVAVTKPLTFTASDRASGGYYLNGLWDDGDRVAYVYKGAQSGTSYSIYLYVPMTYTYEEETYLYYDCLVLQSDSFDIEYQAAARMEWYNQQKGENS